ncbi:hypothetical protein LHJ74_22190 [Streptomyces sp. N2-109]|uniref:Integral membrane protein n=1 Tax=Streptomyces gossypii TaxID=2883101 RepID=A0ABT2JZ27_9ACTN|nr:hypothetical protein [Streptomyces gossypii]MCT2592585.1 hypothetical protein [Streptomyces gossypii]
MSTNARITGGIFCLLFALHTWTWVLYDLFEQGTGGIWDLWTRSAPSAAMDSMPATSAGDAGLGLLQLAAAFAAFTAAGSAGGLLAVTCALTFAYRVPVIWHAASHEESSPWYTVQGFFDDASLDAALISCGWVAVFTGVLAVVLLAGRQEWPPAPNPYEPSPEPPLPSESPQLPTKAGAVVIAVCLGIMTAYGIGWNIHTAAESGGETWRQYFLGEHAVLQLLDVAPAWRWTMLAVIGAVGVSLAANRRVSARGFAFGVVLAVLPEAVTTLWQYADSERLFELDERARMPDLMRKVELLLTLVGGLAVLALGVRPGTPVTPEGPEEVPFTPLTVELDPYDPHAGPHQQYAQPYQPYQPQAYGQAVPYQQHPAPYLQYPPPYQQAPQYQQPQRQHPPPHYAQPYPPPPQHGPPAAHGPPVVPPPPPGPPPGY